MKITKSCTIIGTIRCLLSPRFVAVLVAVVAVTAIVGLRVIGLTVVRGDSMQPTLRPGSIRLVNKIDRSFDTYDIVVFRSADDYLVKRVVGCPGDTVLIRDGAVYVNGAQFADVVQGPIETDSIGITPITLQDDEYFVLGDNRSCSLDSRSPDVGIVHVDQIVGKIVQPAIGQ